MTIPPVVHLCLTPTIAYSQLERLSNEDWEDVRLLDPVEQLGASTYRASGLLLHGTGAFRVLVDPVEVLDKLEAFRLTVVGQSPHQNHSSAVPSSAPQTLLHDFAGRTHKLLLATRRHVGRRHGEQIHIDVDDMLILRGTGNREVFIIADQQQPGSVIVEFERNKLPDDGTTLVALRHL